MVRKKTHIFIGISSLKFAGSNGLVSKIKQASCICTIPTEHAHVSTYEHQVPLFKSKAVVHKINRNSIKIVKLLYATSFPLPASVDGFCKRELCGDALSFLTMPGFHNVSRHVDVPKNLGWWVWKLSAKNFEQEFQRAAAGSSRGSGVDF